MRALSDQWWKLPAAGLAIVAAFAVVTSITGELGSQIVWFIAMIILAIGVTLTVTGVVIAARRALRRRHDA